MIFDCSKQKFPPTVAPRNHLTYMQIKFDEAAMAQDQQLEDRGEQTR